ncbi:hypothetical protein J7I94_19215 [Streptomyces sp. ISL-12]|uniref:hypothetical protein n=1 Tax=Streptomyces sp. ISL-12 TaxID=2819177 RepID=UPI001BEA3B8D|nr:hypothetical protein [Streptomyces sp. ISL-12]MBT2412665.1 hypothetical protein [Streptomyces sp. ISL-12]
MTDVLARMLFETWAAQYDPKADAGFVRQQHGVLSTVCPHLYPPQVPATFRGPKWGKR